MKLEEIMIKLFDFSRPTYFKRKREQLPILVFLEKYFSKEELEEYVTKGKIKKLELIKNLSTEELELKLTNEPISAFDDEYIIKNLTFKFLLFNNKEALITLRKIFENIKDEDISKNRLLEIMQDYPVKFWSTETKSSKKSAIFFIDKLLTNYEVNILLQHKQKIFTSFYDISDIDIR